MFSVFGRWLITKTCAVSRSCDGWQLRPPHSDCAAETGMWRGGHLSSKEKVVFLPQNNADPEIPCGMHTGGMTHTVILLRESAVFWLRVKREGDCRG